MASRTMRSVRSCFSCSEPLDGPVQPTRVSSRLTGPRLLQYVRERLAEPSYCYPVLIQVLLKPGEGLSDCIRATQIRHSVRDGVLILQPQQGRKLGRVKLVDA